MQICSGGIMGHRTEEDLRRGRTSRARTLDALEKGGRMSVAQLAVSMGSTSRSISNNIANLRNQGAVRDTGRTGLGVARFWEITETGREILRNPSAWRGPKRRHNGAAQMHDDAVAALAAFFDREAARLKQARCSPEFINGYLAEFKADVERALEASLPTTRMGME